MKVREVLRLLLDDGWYPVTTRGSHRQFKREGPAMMSPREPSTSILKQANLKL
jgi:predicted RNA binding protein YcfA (HicA-like mRNA interferase family)